VKRFRKKKKHNRPISHLVTFCAILMSHKDENDAFTRGYRKAIHDVLKFILLDESTAGPIDLHQPEERKK